MGRLQHVEFADRSARGRMLDRRNANRKVSKHVADKTLFERIADREVPAEFVHEDDDCFAIRDINPQAPVHVLIIPRKPIASLDDLTPDDAGLVGKLFVVAREIARQEGLANGYRTVFNCGKDGQQTVPHLHMHLLGGRQMSWPPG